MNRRTFFTALAALPFVGALARKEPRVLAWTDISGNGRDLISETEIINEAGRTILIRSQWRRIGPVYLSQQSNPLDWE